MSKVKVVPSLLAGDFGKLAEEAQRVEQAGADALHLDVMDGHFVPNLTMGPAVVAAVNRATDLFLDVHLMIYNPYDYIERFVEAGADRITFHFEATEDVEATLAFIRRCNVEAGLAFRPETSPSFITRFIDKVDLLLLMTVNPGFGGQEFITDMLDKIRFAREEVDRCHIRSGGYVVSEESTGELPPPFQIQVDGGITQETGAQCVEAGANVLVAGTYLLKAPNLAERIAGLHGLGRG